MNYIKHQQINYINFQQINSIKSINSYPQFKQTSMLSSLERFDSGLKNSPAVNRDGELVTVIFEMIVLDVVELEVEALRELRHDQVQLRPSKAVAISSASIEDPEWGETHYIPRQFLAPRENGMYTFSRRFRSTGSTHRSGANRFGSG